MTVTLQAITSAILSFIGINALVQITSCLKSNTLPYNSSMFVILLHISAYSINNANKQPTCK